MRKINSFAIFPVRRRVPVPAGAWRRRLLLVVGFLVILACWWLVLAVLPAMAVERFVGTSGNDGNSCAAATNLTTPKRTINAGIGCLSASDILTILPGTYDENIDDIIPSGTSSAPTIVRAQTRRTAVIQPTVKRLNGIMLRIGSLQTGPPLKSWITIQGLVLDGSSLPLGSRATGIEVANNQAVGPTRSGTHDILLDDIEVRHLPDTNRCSTGDDLSLGMNTGGSDYLVTVRNSKFWDIGRDSQTDPGTCTGGAHYFYSYCLYLSGTEHVVEGTEIGPCTAHSIHNYSAHTDPQGNNIYRNNFIHHAGDALLTSCGGSNNQVYNNILWNNGFTGPWQRVSTIRLGGSCSGYASSASFVYHNTIVGNRGPCVELSYAAGVPTNNNIVQNNICYGNSTDAPVVGNGTGNIITPNLNGTNPQFVSASPSLPVDFKLQATSPARNTGATGTGVTTDYGAQARDAQPDMGAWEYSSGGAPSLPPEVLRWRMNEGTGGTTQDATGNGYTGTLVGPPTWGPGREGPRSLTFDGATTYVQNTALVWPAGQPMTVAFWVLSTGLANLTGGFGLGAADRPNRFGMHVPWGGDGLLACDYGNDLTGGRVSVAMAPYIGKWTHVACSSNGTSGMVLYINGQPVVVQATASAPSVPLTGLEVGRWQVGTAGPFYHTGQIDDFRLYSVVLSSAEVLQLYRSTAGIKRHALVGLR